MFYYPNVLYRHAGCFSTIWLAATKGIRITRREFLKVNIGKTCEDIMDYVLVRVPPLHPSLPRPRFSLYLSSQLQYGVVIVYHRQCAFLLGKMLALDIPDPLFLMEEAGGAIEPFFGVMGIEYELPRPCQLPQLSTYSLSPSEGLTVSPETITIKDKEPPSILTAEFGGAELPEVTALQIELLMQQEDPFLLTGDADTLTKRVDASLDGRMDVSLFSLRVNRSWIIEDTGRPVEVFKQMVAMEKTPPPLTVPAISEPSEKDLEQNQDTECSKNRRHHCLRKRQLIFADQHMQISQHAMREQISNPLTETHALVCFMHMLQSEKFYSLFHPDLRSLWKQCCLLPLKKRQRLQERSEPSEMERERSVEEDRQQRRSESSREVGASWQQAALHQSCPLRKMLNTYLQHYGEVSFHSLLPPEADRGIVAHVFYKVLELVCLKKLWVRQTEPYGLIAFRNTPL
uniref:Rad21/Rec8-like protein N-terminal domain-containing protein n=1 Tax=Electrophorus electricus TaxID=8005 RepID=A0A4W4G6G8_ELEEL